ncbi:MULTISPECIES: hypothetical protein [Olivibacter]|uniref:Uncharacterized protein n=1 Tax=Olivibacter oleidegradans TaxID=760123 RepID=A0ABV6HK22_9SPHI|nr:MULTISPECIES: hypothetical protein [Olivibacter]MDM8175285.1 hypothetical protein [Olivibacter sp. 47]
MDPEGGSSEVPLFMGSGLVFEFKIPTQLFKHFTRFNAYGQGDKI